MHCYFIYYMRIKGFYLNSKPVYLDTYATGELDYKINQANEALTHCTLCPRSCNIDRTGKQRGICKTGVLARVSLYQPHFGEEKPLVGSGGSGTIFFTHCNLMCNFCQNFDISHHGYGDEVSPEQLANMMVYLQNYGCHNINLVTPSHVVPQILSALKIAIEKGLSIPLVYNTSSFDSVFSLKLLEGIVDIYLPDIKYLDPYKTELTMNAPDYPQVAKRAVREMYRQVGDLIINDKGIAERGLLVRHLVMPGETENLIAVLKFLINEISSNTHINLLGQYHPAGTAANIQKLAHGLSIQEYQQSLNLAREFGVKQLMND